MAFVPSFSVGDTVTHQELCTEFKCGNMGGMRRSHATNTLVIISDHTKALYDDKWYGNNLHYTGMGKSGNQTLNSQNRTLAESDTNGVDVHLFEVLKPTQYIYHGIVKLCGEPYQETQNDDTGIPRKVWMFPLTTVEQSTTVGAEPFTAYVSIQEKKAKEISFSVLEKRAKERSSNKAANRYVSLKTYIRDPYVSEYAKRRANGVCQLCGKPAPFKDNEGKPYLETHHIIWLTEGGEDSPENTVALCPNCHRKVHVVNDSADVKTLLKNVKSKDTARS